VYGPKLALPTGRAAWPSLTKPKDPPPPMDGQAPGQPRYEITFVLTKGDVEVENFIKEVQTHAAQMLAMFNEKRSAKIGEILILGDGDKFDAEKYPYYKGKHILIARNVKMPAVVDVDVADVSPDTIKPGNLVRGVVVPLITAHGLSYKIDTVQFIADDGVAFGGNQPSSKSLLGLLGRPAEAAPATAQAPAPAPAEVAAPAPVAAVAAPVAQVEVAQVAAPAAVSAPVAAQVEVAVAEALAPVAADPQAAVQTSAAPMSVAQATAAAIDSL